MKNKTIKAFALCGFMVLSVSLFAGISINIKLPEITYDGTTIDVGKLNIADLEGALKREFGDSFGQKNLAQGFGNANAFVGNGATFNGFQGYKIFGIQAGAMLGFQLPTLDLDELLNFGDTIGNSIIDGDGKLGLAVAIPVFNIGINAEKVFGFFGLGDMFKNFYFNVKFGKTYFENMFGQGAGIGEKDMNLLINSTIFGLGVNYQILRPLRLPLGILSWRGLSLGSGFFIHNNEISVVIDLHEIKEPIIYNSEKIGTLAYTPGIKLGTTSKIFVIPLEAVTALQILGLNVNAGLGVDLAFGTSEISAGARGEATVEVSKSGYSAKAPSGSVEFTATTEANPQFFNPRLMAGLGMSIGPVKLDIPIYYYFSSGLAVGLSLGLVW